MSNSKKNALKLLTASICMVILIILMVCVSVKPNKLLGSVYNINDIDANINKIKVGDVINYEINGNSKWKVIYIDKLNNTVDVVSKDNLGEITLKDKNDFNNALNTLQEEANKYVDGKYAISARSVTRADLEYFAFDKDFWTADNYNGSIATSNGKITYVDKNDFANDFYYLPFIEYRLNNTEGYNNGDEYNKDINGISKWFVVTNNYNNSLVLIPKDPIKFNVNNYSEFINCPDCIFNDIFNEYYQADSNVLNIGHLLQHCVGDCCEQSCVNDFQNIRNYYASKNIEFKILRGYFGTGSSEGYKSVYLDYDKFRLDDKWLGCCYGEDYKEYSPVTKGFRPVVTLKFSDKSIDGKETNTDLKVGDNVNYSALGYQNWRVLSIDENNNTVDIVSGGVVKNLYLQGQDDFDNYEDLLQMEVDAYKSGDKVISARTLEYADLSNLNKINDKVNAKYWINAKRQFNKKANDETSSPYNGMGYFNVGIMYYNQENISIEKKWVSLYIAPTSNQDGSLSLSSTNGIGNLSFTAGIRPVITLKLDQVEKLDENTKVEVINESNELDNKINKEQSSNNYYNITNYDSSDNDDKTSDSIVKGGAVNNYYGNSNGDDDKLIKYVLIGLIILNVSIIAQVILSAVIFKKIKKK